MSVEEVTRKFQTDIVQVSLCLVVWDRFVIWTLDGSSGLLLPLFLYPLHLCPLSRGWPMPRQQRYWSGMVLMLSPLHPPPQSGSSSVASCLVGSPSCCGPVPFSAFWPTPSKQPQRTILQATTWAQHAQTQFVQEVLHKHIPIWPTYTSLTHLSRLGLWSRNNIMAN